MPHPGPWEQPPDVTYTDRPALNLTPASIYVSDISTTEGAGAPDAASAWTHPTSGGSWFLAEQVFRDHALGTTRWLRQLPFAAVDLTQLDLTSPGPTPAELADPNYVTWEPEAPIGTVHYPVEIRLELTINGIGYTDDVEHKPTAPAPDIMQGAAELRRPPASAYTLIFGSVMLTSDDWPDPAGWPVVVTESLLAGKTVAVSGGDGYTDNILTAPGSNTFTQTATYTAVDLDDGLRLPLLLTLSRWAAGDVLTEPQVTDPPAIGHGFTSAEKGGATGGPFLVNADARVTFTVTPPRYRVIYAVEPAQRQYPRDDGLGASTRRSWPPPTSKQYGQRRGTSATYQ